MAPTNVPMVRRGDGGGWTATDTVYATVPPNSTQHHGRPIPKIAGSEGGFIGLVTGLGVLIVACSITVWILLKRRNNQKGGRHVPIMSRLRGKSSQPPPDSKGSRKFGRFGGDAQSEQGWVRTNDNEDDYSDDDDEPGKNMKMSEGQGYGYTGKPEDRAVYSGDSNPFATPSTTKFAMTPAGPYNDAFDARPSTDSLDNAVLGKGGERHSDDDTSPIRPQFQERESSSFASPTSPTGHGGTRFRENV